MLRVAGVVGWWSYIHWLVCALALLRSTCMRGILQLALHCMHTACIAARCIGAVGGILHPALHCVHLALVPCVACVCVCVVVVGCLHGV